jgi:hypothetical protein
MTTNELNRIVHAIDRGNILTEKVTPIASGTSAATSLTSISATDASGFTKVCLQLDATSLDTADGVIKLQESSDNVNFVDIPLATITVNSGTSSNVISYSELTNKYVRPHWNKGTVSSGTIKCDLIFKK